MTDNKISQEDIAVFFMRLYKHTDKLMVLWLTFCAAFFSFLVLIKVFTLIWKQSGFVISVLSLPALYILTDVLASFVIVLGMKVVKKSLQGYIYQRQGGFQEFGTRWKVSNDEWLTLELVLDYKNTVETQMDKQEEAKQLMELAKYNVREYVNDFENADQVNK